MLAHVQACTFCRLPGGKQRQTQQYCKGQSDYSFQTPETPRIMGETTTKLFTHCLFQRHALWTWTRSDSAAIASIVFRTANPSFLSCIITFQGYMFIRIQNWVILATCTGIDSSAKNNTQLPESYANAQSSRNALAAFSLNASWLRCAIFTKGDVYWQPLVVGS